MAEEEFNSSCYDHLGGLGCEATQLVELNARALARALILVYIYRCIYIYIYMVKIKLVSE